MPTTPPSIDLPDTIDSEEQLDQLLTTPSPALVEAFRALSDPLIILGAGGKMGPTLAVLARKAAEQAGNKMRVIAASRFSKASSRQWLNDRGVETLSADIFDRGQLAALPDSSNVIYLVGMKFGTSDDPVPTWATNTIAPVHVCERYAGSRIVALSTGNVYPMCRVDSGGSVESDPLTPQGEYANAAVARERVFQHYAANEATPCVLMRLNYAHDLRYGVLTDLAGKIWREETIDLSMGYFNAMWQGDANEMILRSFPLCASPARALNLTSPAIHSVRSAATRLGELLGRQPQLVGQEEPTALLSNTAALQAAFGQPQVDFDRMLTWIAAWTRNERATLGKPTHFETRDGNY
ncbi:MAG: NAD(P)-dependent oxidoreductase [Planctomycetales bacterium]|nr:NAD(P)-dependent oxidoreductase [Planctomycetales bacterium]